MIFATRNSTTASAPTEKMRITSSGEITTPLNPAFRVTRTTGSNWAWTSTTATQPFDYVIYDKGGNYDNSTYKFTCPVAGVYTFTHQCNAYGVASTEYVRIEIATGTSGSYYLEQISFHTYPGSGDQYATGTVQLDLAAGETVWAQVYIYGGTAGFSSNSAGIYNAFSGHLIG